VGVLTALCGGPFFLWLLKSKQKKLMAVVLVGGGSRSGKSRWALIGAKRGGRLFSSRRLRRWMREMTRIANTGRNEATSS
jgi:hypothetical protein